MHYCKVTQCLVIHTSDEPWMAGPVIQPTASAHWRQLKTLTFFSLILSTGFDFSLSARWLMREWISLLLWWTASCSLLPTQCILCGTNLLWQKPTWFIQPFSMELWLMMDRQGHGIYISLAWHHIIKMNIRQMILYCYKAETQFSSKALNQLLGMTLSLWSQTYSYLIYFLANLSAKNY